MDKLTLVMIAAHSPFDVLEDADRDWWHACCLLGFADKLALDALVSRTSVLQRTMGMARQMHGTAPNHRCFSSECSAGRDARTYRHPDLVPLKTVLTPR